MTKPLSAVLQCQIKSRHTNNSLPRNARPERQISPRRLTPSSRRLELSCIIGHPKAPVAKTSPASPLDLIFLRMSVVGTLKGDMPQQVRSLVSFPVPSRLRFHQSHWVCQISSTCTPSANVDMRCSRLDQNNNRSRRINQLTNVRTLL